MLYAVSSDKPVSMIWVRLVVEERQAPVGVPVENRCWSSVTGLADELETVTVMVLVVADAERLGAVGMSPGAAPAVVIGADAGVPRPVALMPRTQRV